MVKALGAAGVDKAARLRKQSDHKGASDDDLILTVGPDIEPLVAIAKTQKIRAVNAKRHQYPRIRQSSHPTSAPSAT